MKIIIAPDKFKGSLTSAEACSAIAAGITAAITAGIAATQPKTEILQYPMADGGDGFESVLKHYLKTTTITCPTQDPIGRPITASYELSDNTAIIGLAAASGLALLKDSEKDALNASSYGTGVLIKDALRRGVKRIHLGLGGSASTDAGTGILSALGFQFLDGNDQPLQPGGASLAEIQKIIPPEPLPDIVFEIAADVQNPLYGPRGAAQVYARQKGATDDDIKTLDHGLQHVAGILQQHYNRNFSSLSNADASTSTAAAHNPHNPTSTAHSLTNRPDPSPTHSLSSAKPASAAPDLSHLSGVGAAGGISAGLIPFFPTNIHSGIETIIQASGIASAIPGATLLITGEGKIDNQTADGKVIASLSALAAKHGVPVIAFCGITDLTPADAALLGLQAIYPITPPGMPIAEAMANAAALLQQQAAAAFAKFNL